MKLKSSLAVTFLLLVFSCVAQVRKPLYGKVVVSGEGNSLNYTFRMHDPRMGSFFAVDLFTAKYPSYSPYKFSGNRLTDMVELEGVEPAEPGTGEIEPPLNEYKALREYSDELIFK